MITLQELTNIIAQRGNPVYYTKSGLHVVLQGLDAEQVADNIMLFRDIDRNFIVVKTNPNKYNVSFTLS